MQKASLSAKRRVKGKNSLVKQARREGRIPAVLYGMGGEAELLELDEETLAPVMRQAHGTTLLIDLAIEGTDSSVKTVFREVQRHPITRVIKHCDLLKVDMTRRYNVTVPIVVEGEPVGVKTFGGVLAVVTREVEILCLPADIPESYTLEISELSIGDSIHVADLKKQGDEEFLTSEDVVVVSVHVARLEEEPEVEAAELAEGEEAPVAEGEEAAADEKKEEDSGSE